MGGVSEIREYTLRGTDGKCLIRQALDDRGWDRSLRFLTNTKERNVLARVVGGRQRSLSKGTNVVSFVFFQT